MITRREFVACVGCAAVAGKLMGQEADASNIEKLITTCGLYCGACFAYLATKENNEQRIAVGFGTGWGAKSPSLASMQCDGCLGGGRILGHVPRCAMRECAAVKTKTGRCADCDELPCSLITAHSNDGMPHRAEAVENSRQIRKMGITEWAKREVERWSCPKCGMAIAWYDPECTKCKAPRSDKLFPLKKA